jgi:hypothetical protein
MKVLLIDGVPYFYRPENKEDKIEFLEALRQSIEKGELKIPKKFTKLIEELKKLTDKTLDECILIFDFSPELQSLASSIYQGDHREYDPTKMREVNFEDEDFADKSIFLKEQIKNHKLKPLK